MIVSLHEAAATLRYSQPERLRPWLAEFIDDQLEQIARDRDPSEPEPATRDARADLVAWLKELGGPWFAFSSYVLPGWTWISVPIQPAKTVEAHLRWMEMRIGDFRREVGRLGDLFAFEAVGLEPETFVRRGCMSELPRAIEAHDNAGEIYDAIQHTCDLMLDAARLPRDEAVGRTIDGFFRGKPPTEEELGEFIDDLAGAVARAFFARFGRPPHAELERELIGLERRTEHLRWEAGWLRARIARQRYLDDQELDELRADLERVEGIIGENTARLGPMFDEVIRQLESELDELEQDWVGASERESVVTEARLDRQIGTQVTRLASLKARRGQLEAA